MSNRLAFYPDGTAPQWAGVVSAAEVGGGLLCFLSPPSVRPGPDRGARAADELLLRWPGQERRARIELVRLDSSGPGWACFVIRGRGAEA